MPRSTPVALGAAFLIAACAAEDVTTPGRPEFPEAPLPDLKLEMTARIDGRDYAASAPSGFTVGQIEINRGGSRLSASFRNAGDRAGPGRVHPDGCLQRHSLLDRPGQEVALWLGLLHQPTGQHVLEPFRIGLRRRSHDGLDGVEPRVRQASS